MERMKSKAGYGAVVVLTLIIALTHEGEFPRFLLGFEVVLAAALFFSLKVLAGKIEVHFRLPVSYCRSTVPLKRPVRGRSTG